METNNRNRYVKEFDANSKGRDFIIGDLHGMTSFLEAGLEHLNFDPASDRVFSVGDLVDRGSDSKNAMLLVDQPWFHAVRGNHEQMMIDAANEDFRGTAYDSWMYNGGKNWATMESPQTLVQLAKKANKLPIVIIVGKDTPTRFNIVHAEFYVNHGYVSDDDLDSEQWWTEKTQPNISYPYGSAPVIYMPQFIENLMWGRTIITYGQQWSNQKNLHEDLFKEPQKDLSITYVGHTPVQGEVVIYGSHCYIDTGAVFAKRGISTSSGLTIVNHTDMTYINVNLFREGDNKFMKRFIPTVSN